MTRRTLSLISAALLIAACSSDSTENKDLAVADGPPAADVKLGEGQGKDQPQLLPDLPLPVADLPRTEGGALDQGKTTDKGKAGELGSKDKGPASDGPASCGKIRCDCYAFSTKQNKWLPLWGKANQVSIGVPDFKVKVVNFNGALKVKQATIFAQKCGEWQSASALPDFSYQIVTFAEDFTIQYDQVFPGINTVACPACK